MFRHAQKYLLTVLVSVALVAGFTTASGAAAAPVNRAAPVVAKADCTAQQAALTKAIQKSAAKSAKAKKAKKAVRKAKKAVRKADTRRESVQAAKVLKKAKAVKKKKVKKARKAKASQAAAQAAFNSCSGTPTPGNPGPGNPAPGGPLQPLCAAGLPQAICDALDGLPLPGGDGIGDSPIQALCDAGLPQAICDAANAPALPSGDNPIQALCDAGLPQGICDLAAGGIGSGSLPIPGGLPGLPDLAFPGVPDIDGLPGAVVLQILLDALGLGDLLPLGTVCATVQLPVVCDVV